MKTNLDCIPCFLDQALRAGRIYTDDKKLLKQILDEVATILPDVPLDHKPPETGDLIYKKIKKITKTQDPLKSVKRKSTEEALELFPLYEKKLKAIESQEKKLLFAIKLAIAGNIIDFAVEDEFDIKKDVDEVLNKELAINHIEKFKKELEKAETILYIADNAGETVFDRFLISELDHKVLYVVRDEPVINDATREDAKAAGIDELATIIESGSSSPGLLIKNTTSEFKKLFQKADMVISKGQGNFEGLSEEDRPIFFLLKAKCEVIANNMGVSKDDIVLKAINI
ncbi:MAG: DUF89 family protein [Candidatus Cloacimonetes bacterium]|nr:DUF89 family protein [Candidatus Cloacimonadota bacterium]